MLQPWGLLAMLGCESGFHNNYGWPLRGCGYNCKCPVMGDSPCGKVEHGPGQNAGGIPAEKNCRVSVILPIPGRSSMS